MYIPGWWRYDGFDYLEVEQHTSDCEEYADMLIKGFLQYKKIGDVELFLEYTSEFMNTNFWMELEKPYDQFMRDIHKNPPVYSRQDEELPPA